MQGHKDQRVHKDRDHGPAVAPAQFLIQIAPVHDLLCPGLNHDAEQEEEKQFGIKCMKRQFNIPLQTGHQNAESVHGESQQKTDQNGPYVVAVPVVEKGLPHRPVIFKEQDHHYKNDPDTEKFKIHQQKGQNIYVSDQAHAELQGRQQAQDDIADDASELDQQERQ